MEKIKKDSGYLFAAVFTNLILASFLTQDIYAATTKYSSLIIFAVFAVMILPYVRPSLRSRDRNFTVLILVICLSALNLVIVRSNKGAVLIPSDMAMGYFLAEKLRLQEKLSKYMAFAGSALIISWFGFIKWHYNYNMVGLVFMMILITGEMFLEFMKLDRDLEYLGLVQILLWAVGFIWSMLYHSRCAAAGIIIFGILLLAGRKIAGSRLLYTAAVVLSTIGSILFTLFYILLGKTGFNMKILYKDILSGRQDIWAELWQAFLKQPLTGVGSSYKLKSFEIFEVHNGLFDILTVHGAVVFGLLVYMLIRLLMKLREDIYMRGGTAVIAMAGIFAMLFTSFFENFFTVPPYSVFFFYLLLECTRCMKRPKLV